MSPAACAKCLCLFPTATSPVKKWCSSRKVSAPALRALLALAPWEAWGKPCVCCCYCSPAFGFAAQAVRDLGGRIHLMFAPASNDHRSWDTSRECQEAAAFPELCCRGSWGLASSDVESFQCCSKTGKESLSKTQDRANVSCTVLSVHVVVLSVPGASPCAVTDVLSSFSWLPTPQWAQHIHLLHFLCGGSHRQEEKIWIGLLQEDDFSFHSITRKHTNTYQLQCCLVQGIHPVCPLL